MNNDDALYLLGIEGTADPSAVRQAYERRRLEFEQRLTNAQSDGLKQKYHSTLSDLDQAYELLVGPRDPTLRRGNKSSMSGANASSMAVNASTGGTLLRTGDSPQKSEGLAIGRVLANRYEIQRVLGQGGMGAVYAAYDRLKQEDVAIKVLLPQFLSSEQGRDRFMHEAKVACRLSHPNIVKVFDVGLAEPYHFITMELLEGETLRQQMEARKSRGTSYSVPEVLNYAGQLTTALAYAHKQIVHRDLKPENVWVCKDGTLKLIDFGIAHAFTKSALTRTGMVMGTAYYMAPEQFNGAKSVDWRADQYSLAVMIYELLTGRIPQGTFAATNELRKDVSIGTSRALMKALAPDPSGRFATLDEFSTALTSKDAAPSFLKRKPVIWTVVASMAIAVVAIALWTGGAFKRSPESVAAEAVASLASPDVTGSALEGETLSLSKRLQEREQELSEHIDQQQARYDRAASAPGAAVEKSPARIQANREERELKLLHEIQQETRTTVFSEQQSSTRDGQLHAAQKLLTSGDVDAAIAQFNVARDSLLKAAKQMDDIESFVRARADYFDVKQRWLQYSFQHGGKISTNPNIGTAEEGIQAAVDRGEYANLATDVFPRLTDLYGAELRSAQRRDNAQARTLPTKAPAQEAAVVPSPAVADAAPATEPAAETRSTPLTSQEIKAERARVAAERKRAALLEKCATARHRPHGCPKPGAN